jgi:hypothetical protein
MQQITPAKIEKMIYLIRGQKVMLDSDLAKLYGVDTGALNRQVKRNLERFPSDFMFQLTKEEVKRFREQDHYFQEAVSGRKYQPFVFTEYGIAALSGVIKSKVAIKVNNSIIRTFVKMRQLLAHDQSLIEKLAQLEKGTDQLFRIVFERLDALEADAPILSSKRKRIGFNEKK